MDENKGRCAARSRMRRRRAVRRLVKALVMMFKKSKKGTIPYIVMAFAFAATALFDHNVLIVVACCAAIGIITSMTAKKEAAEK